MRTRIAAVTLALSSGLWAQASDPTYFAAKVYPVLEAAQCRGCHSRDGVASATRLHFPEAGSSQTQVQAFGFSLAPLKSLLLVKPTARVAHTGGERIKPGSEEEKVLSQWVDYLGTLPEESLTSLRNLPAPGSSKSNQFVRRLTHTQYNNTVRDLLGDMSQPASRFPPEDYADGFKNQLSLQGAPPLLVEAYATTAEKLALNAFRAGDLNGLIPCRPASASDAKCRDQFIRAFGLRAFRYPLRSAELQRYAAAFNVQARATGKFLEGARVVVEAMLQSPKFLFHVQPGDYGVASRLSYLLWNTMPDQALLDAAANGELRTSAARERWARRMLESPLARPAIDEFFLQWLRLDRVLNVTKERRQYPEFTPELAAAMVEETRLLLQHLVWQDGNFMDTLRADYGFLNPELASVYRMPAPASPFDLVRFPAATQRAGLLGHGSILAATAGPAETSPTARGIFIREQLLCQHVPPPPSDVNTTLPELSPDKPLTRRQRMTAHAENPACAACHKLMDPIGFGLESFDAIGRWRDKESVPASKKVELALDTKGEIAGLPNSAFADSKELGRVLAESPVCQECVTRQVFRYAYGRRESPADQETLRALSASFRESGFRFKELWVAIVRSPEFVRGLDSLDSKSDYKTTQQGGNNAAQ